MSDHLSKPLSHESRFLSELDKQAIDSILAGATTRRVPAKRAILSAGQPATHMFLLRKGRARYYVATSSGDEIVLRVLVRGDVFGLGTLLRRPTTYLGNAETISDCELLVWEQRAIRKLASRYPKLAENSLGIVLQYLRRYMDRHSGLVSKTAEQRLAFTLLDLSHRMGNVQAGGVEVDATNEQLSSLSDISPFTTSRLLSRWSRDGAVSKKRGMVVIHTPEALAID